MTLAPVLHGIHPAPKSGFVFFVALLATMFVCVALPRALVFAPSLIGLIGLAAIYYQSRKLPAFDIKLAGFLAAILAMAFLSVLWSMDFAYALERALKIAPLFIFGFILIAAATCLSPQPAKQAPISLAGILFCAAAAILIFWEYKNLFPLSRLILGLQANTDEASIKSGFILNRSLVYLVLLCMPVSLALMLAPLKRNIKIGLIMVLLACLGAAFFYTKSQTAQFAALTIGFMAFYPSHRKKARLLLCGGLLAMLFALPFLMKPAYEAALGVDMTQMKKDFIYEASIIHRLEVWNFISEEIKERPFFGHGIEATRFLKADEVMPYMATDHVLHPHNVVLQIWVEFGLVGALVCAAFLLFLLGRIEKLPPLLQRYYAALLMAVLCVLSISYGLWQAWQIGMIFALVALSMAITRFYAIPADFEQRTQQNI